MVAGKCVICGITKKKGLTKHHVNGGKKIERMCNPFQKEWANKDLVILCKDCHRKVHDPRYSYKLKFYYKEQNYEGGKFW